VGGIFGDLAKALDCVNDDIHSPATIVEKPILKFLNLKPLKIYDCSSIRQLNVMRNSGGFKTGLSQDA